MNIVTNGQPSSVTLNVDTGDITPVTPLHDSTVSLAEKTGMIDKMNEINAESYQDDHNLRMQYDMQNQANDEYNDNDDYQDQEVNSPDNYQDQPKKKKSPKKKGDSVQKRIDEITYKLIDERREREELERQLKHTRDEHAAYMLSVERDRVAHDMDRVTDVMIKAKENDQHSTYVKANLLMNELSLKKSETTAALNHYQEAAQNVPEDDHYDSHAESRFMELSDQRELSSDAYTNWLRENPYYNPYDRTNYDEDLAKDVHEIKRTFNKFLKKNRNADYIGTPEYYDEVDALSNIKFLGDYQQPQRYSNKGYQEQGDQNMADYKVSIDPEYGMGNAVPEGQNRYQSGMYPDDRRYQPVQQPQQRQQRSGPAPVNRSGYNQGYSSQLPDLSPDEMKMAKVLGSYSKNQYGESISQDEAIHNFRLEKQKMNRR